MSSVKSSARRAGMLYLLLAIVGPFNTVYVPGAFIVPGDATATARNITAAELTYRLGILSELAVDVVFLVLVATLYELLKHADGLQARLMVIFVSVSVAFGLVNLLVQMAPLVLLSGAGFLSAFTKSQLDALALGFLRLRSNGIQLAIAFWGLWLFPFGVLVIKSGLFPKLLGVLLIVGCFAYLTVSGTALVAPAQRAIVDRIAMPFYLIGELSMIVYLLAKGARPQPVETRPT
jgi:uncharacterized membrane protein YwzB